MIKHSRLDGQIDTKYKGNSLAQEIRNLVTDNIIDSFPLILFSGGDNLDSLFKPDKTSHDLFDEKYQKEKLDRKSSAIARKKVITLAKGYKVLARKSADIDFLLGVKDLKDVDYRIIEHLDSLRRKKSPPHEFARFIIKKVIKVPGVLIDKNLLAARLGFDLKKTNSEEIEKLYSLILTTKYIGVFNSGYNRWWMQKLQNWWNENFKISVGNLTGEERVKMLKEKFDVNLSPAEKTSSSKSSKFWYVCKKSFKPIAFEDGIMASSEGIKVSWQEDEYYCFEEAIKIERGKIHPFDRDNLEMLKQKNSKKRKSD